MGDLSCPSSRPVPEASPLASHLAQLGKHSAVLLVGNVLSRGVGMILIPLYTGILSPAEFNSWEALLLAATVVSMVSAHGITAALMWTLKTGGAGGQGELSEERRQHVISAAVGWALLAAAVVCGGAMLVAGPLAGLTTNVSGYGSTLALLLAAQALRVVTWPAEGVLKLRFQSLPIVFMSFGEFLVQLVGTIVALTVLDMRLEGMAWAAFLAALLRFALGWAYLPEMRRPRLDLSLTGPMVRYGLPLMPGAIAAMVLSLSDRWFFAHYGMQSEGGLYSYGDKWARIVDFLLITPLVAMWPAVFFNIARESDAKRQFGRMATLFAGVGGTLAFVITQAGPALTRWFDTSSDDAFAGGVAAIGVLTAGYVLFGLNEVARVGFQLTGRTRRTALCMVLAALLNLALNALLIPRFGALGAAWATLVAYATTVILSLLLSRDVYPQRWEGLRLLHVAVIYVGGAWAVAWLGPPDDSAAGLATRGLAAVLAPLLLLATGFLRADERAALAGHLRRLLRRGPPRSPTPAS